MRIATRVCRPESFVCREVSNRDDPGRRLIEDHCGQQHCGQISAAMRWRLKGVKEVDQA
jgi:hypothetical protein